MTTCCGRATTQDEQVLGMEQMWVLTPNPVGKGGQEKLPKWGPGSQAPGCPPTSWVVMKSEHVVSAPATGSRPPSSLAHIMAVLPNGFPSFRSSLNIWSLIKVLQRFLLDLTINSPLLILSKACLIWPQQCIHHVCHSSSGSPGSHLLTVFLQFAKSQSYCRAFACLFPQPTHMSPPPVKRFSALFGVLKQK